MNVIVSFEQPEGDPTWPEARASEVVRFALGEMDVPDNAEASFTLVGTDRIHELNREFRGVDAPTDVLSFPCDDPWADGAADQPAVELGDIVIAPAVCAAQAPGFGNTFDEEMTMLTVHSALHLLGYDHIEEDDAARMQAEERRILTAWRAREGLPARQDVLGYERPAGERPAPADGTAAS